MATYYKYAEKSAGSQVNWAEIGKNLTDTLQEENKLREQKKAAIDEATRQYGLTLEKSPQGDFKPLNQWGLDYAADAQEARLLQDRLLKSGKLKLRDYTMMRQNLTDGTKQAFDLLDEYNAEYKEKMARAQSTNPATASQVLERWLMEQAEGFANFKDSKLYINPTTFAVNIAKIKRENGVEEMSTNPNDFTSVNELRNRIKARYDRFDSDAYLQKQVAMLGKDIRTSIIERAGRAKAGIIETKEDITARNDWEKTQDAMIDAAFAGNPTHVSSVLTDDLGMDDKGNTFSFTFDKNEMGKVVDGKNLIYFDENGQPQFTRDQKILARNAMKNKMNMMLDYEEKIQTYTNPTPPQKQQWEVMMGQDKNARLNLANMLLKLKNGTQEEVQAAVDYFRLVNPKGIREIARWGDPSNGNGGVTYITADGTTNYLTRNDNDADWIRAAAGAFLGKDANGQDINLNDVVDEAIKASGGTSTWDDYGEISNRATQVVQPPVQDANTNFWNNIAIPVVPGSGGGSGGGSGTGKAGTF